MKKIILTISFLLIGLFALGHRAEAVDFDCPPGYNTSQAISVPLMIDGCTYEVYLCYDCALTHLFLDIKILGYRKVDLNCQHFSLNTEDDIVHAIEEEILKPSFVYEILCINVPPVPCDEQENPCAFDVAVDHYGCWCKWLDNEGEYVWRVPCNPNHDLCRIFYRYCLLHPADPPDPAIYKMEIVEITHFPDDGCDVMDPLPPDPEIPGGYSPCYHVSTLCD